MLYINYGVPKSGSTLTFELARNLLERAGHPQFALSAEVRQDRGGRTNYANAVRDWTPEVIASVEAAAPRDTIFLVRTHRNASPEVADLIVRGGARHMVCIRDPRDIALSMLDVVSRLEDQGRRHENIRPGDLTTTLAGLKVNLDFSLGWADIPGALILDYEQTAFAYQTTLDAICSQLGLGDLRHLYEEVFDAASARMEGKKNAARPHRHRREMSAQQQQVFLDHFADYYARFYPTASVEVQEEDEAELAKIVERRELQRQRRLDREARLAAIGSASSGETPDRELVRQQRQNERMARQQANLEAREKRRR
jgi:hypothetical protein